MDFDTFKANLVVIDNTQGSSLRERYIETFVDTNHKWYHDRIGARRKYIDGYCYEGYLWDCLKNKELVSAEYIKELSENVGTVYVFWDMHSCERIFIEDYWKFAKDAVLELKFDTLIQGREFLPEDIYIFDNSFKWTLVLTHEDIDGAPYYLIMNK